MFLIVDAHEDLAYNVLTFGRDYSLSAEATRFREKGQEVVAVNGDTLLGYPDYRRGRVALVFSTLFASPYRYRPGEAEPPAWETQTYRDIEEAHAIYRRQVEVYYRMVDAHPDQFRLIQEQKDMEDVLAAWKNIPPDESPAQSEVQNEGQGAEKAPENMHAPEEGEPGAKQGPPVGLVMLMEGAEGVRFPEELEEWWQLGVRLIGLAWNGTRFCGGTHEPGPLTQEGYELLEAMTDTGFGLDLSHMDEEAVLQAMDVYPGVMFASHSNAVTLLNGLETNRHLSDRVIQGLIERNGVIGIVPTNSFLYPHWNSRDGREKVSIERAVAHIDYICQMAGDAGHVGFGTDFDGGFGWQSVPAEIDTIADMQKCEPLLRSKGYSDADIAAIFGENWIHLLRRILPEG